MIRDPKGMRKFVGVERSTEINERKLGVATEKQTDRQTRPMTIGLPRRATLMRSH